MLPPEPAAAARSVERRQARGYTLAGVGETSMEDAWANT